jgi:hypothetical protein
MTAGKTETGNYFHFLGTLSGFPAFRLIPKRFMTTIKAPSPLLPLAGFERVNLESEGKWEGDFFEVIFVPFKAVWMQFIIGEHDEGLNGKSGLFSFFCHDFQTYRQDRHCLCIVQGGLRMNDQKGNFSFPRSPIMRRT